MYSHSKISLDQELAMDSVHMALMQFKISSIDMVPNEYGLSYSVNFFSVTNTSVFKRPSGTICSLVSKMAATIYIELIGRTY